MPPGTRVRYFAPAPEVAPFITAYNVYGSADREPRVDPFLPMMMMLTVLIDAGPVSVTIRHHSTPRVPDLALYGSMTRPLVATTHGGVQVGIGISPVGWARLSRRSAEDFHNRVTPLGDMFGRGWGDRLRADLIAAPSDEDVPAIIDAAFAPLLGTPHPNERLIALLGGIVAADGSPDITEVAARLGMTTAGLRRLSRQHFGLSPKQLLTRARFLRSFLRQSGLDGRGGAGAIDAAYFDESHYLRDAHTFLGTTPRRFLKQPAHFLRGSLASRFRVLGFPAQALHHIDPPSGD